MSLNAEKLREDFEVLKKNITYMDSSCVSLKPRQVVDKINEYYKEYPACGGRSNHRFALEVTNKFEETRKSASKFFNSKHKEEIIFTKNSTEGLNLVAQGLNLKKGDKVLISSKEHNSNLIPWQHKVRRVGIKLEIFEYGNLVDFEKKVKDVKLASFVHTSNLDGSTQDIKEMIKLAQKVGAKTLVDGAQSAPHKEVNLKKLDTDFFVSSGHKMLGPSGTGIFYGKKEELENLEPFITGGETVKDTTYTHNEPEDLPHKFEAGLQNYAGIIGLNEAFKYLNKVGLSNIQKHEIALNKHITENILKIPELKILGPKKPENRGGIISFNVKGVDPHDIALQMDSAKDIMIRSGYHCCHSWFNANNVKGSARASLYLYNTQEEAEKFSIALKDAIKLLK